MLGGQVKVPWRISCATRLVPIDQQEPQEGGEEREATCCGKMGAECAAKHMFHLLLSCSEGWYQWGGMFYY